MDFAAFKIQRSEFPANTSIARHIMFPATTERVTINTSGCVNRDIRQQTEEQIELHRAASEAEIEQRLRELDQEWDIERVLEANGSSIILAGLSLGLTVNRRFLALPAIVSSFLLLHAVQGWCPPLPILRRLGYRTQSEIEQERYALKVLRGDFEEMTSESSTEEIMASVRS